MSVVMTAFARNAAGAALGGVSGIGLGVMVTVELAPGTRVPTAGTADSALYCPAPAPVRAPSVQVMFALPLLVTVNVWTAAVLPAPPQFAENWNDVWLIVMPPATPTPDSGSAAGSAAQR